MDKKVIFKHLLKHLFRGGLICQKYNLQIDKNSENGQN